MIYTNKTSLKKINIISLKSVKNYVLIVFCGILAISSVLMTIDTAASGAEIANLQKQETILSGQKRILEESLVKGISMSELQQKSSELGFIQPTNLVYVSNTENVSAAAPVASLP